MSVNLGFVTATQTGIIWLYAVIAQDRVRYRGSRNRADFPEWTEPDTAEGDLLSPIAHRERIEDARFALRVDRGA